MTHTTPTEAREVADRLEVKKLDVSTWVAVTALRSLATQLEAVTAERDLIASNYKRLKALVDNGTVPEGLLSAGIEQEGEIRRLTADCEKLANQSFAARAEAKALVDHANAERDKCGSGAGCLHKDALIDSLTAERDAYKAELKNWDAPCNDTATFQLWAQSRARAAITKEKS